MGMTRTEAAVMDLWDQGHCKRAIVRQTGLRAPHVASIVTALACDQESRRDQDAIRAGSARLLSALQLARCA